MARHVDFLLLGGGPASATAAETLRAEGADGTITIVAAERALPYFRPPLSKQFLLDHQTRDQLDIFHDAEYREQRIEVLSGTRALGIDPEARIVYTDSAGEIDYDKLLIATGCRPKRLDVPGAELPGSYYLRTVADAEAIKGAAKGASRAVVVGGNFVGMEIASSLRQMGLSVTLLVRGAALLHRFQAPILSAFLLQYFQEHGVEIIFEDTVGEFQGGRGVESVVTWTGRTLPCDLVVLGIGVRPEIEFLKDSGIAVDDGILVDQNLQTNQPHVFAAGDVANYYDPVFGIRRRTEHWDNAVKQGRLAAKSMLGRRQCHGEVSYFFCDIFELTFEFFGYIRDFDGLIQRGSLEERSFALLYMKDEVPRALFSLGRPAQETKAVESLICNHVNLTAFKHRLSDKDFQLETIPAQTVLILQGGGALGAFECGVVKALEEAAVVPDIVAGVSIGAINAAIIASNPKHASAALESFWEDVVFDIPALPNEKLRQMLLSWSVLFFGSPGFFLPRWLMPVQYLCDLPVNWTSLYDPSPVKGLISKYVDFARLKESPVRLLINAVNVETAELETFDSYLDDLTADHVLASGSVPPGFPWTTINDKSYWDGGIVSNSPLDQVVELCGGTNKRVFIIDLYPSKKPLPHNLTGVIARIGEILYSEKIRNDVRTRELIREYRGLIGEILVSVDPMAAGQIKQRPRYIQLMGDMAPMTITRIIRKGEDGEPPPKEYDFSRKSIERLERAGYRAAREALKS
jgi:NTE family protein